MAIAAGTLFPLAGWRMTSDMFRAMKLARKSLRCQLLTKMTVICIRQMMLLFAVWPPDFTQRSYFLQTGHSYQPCSSQDRTGQSPASLQVQNPLRKCPFVATSLRPPFQPKLKTTRGFSISPLLICAVVTRGVPAIGGTYFATCLFRTISNDGEDDGEGPYFLRTRWGCQ